MIVENNIRYVSNKRNEGIVSDKIMITPCIGKEGYWRFKVQLTEDQAIIAFPKFGTLGIGFLNEADDWNTNLPYTCEAEQIYEHIECNKGNEKISKEECIEAIKMIQAVCEEFR